MRGRSRARLIRQALVPTQEVVEIKNGKKVTVERKLYPGYVLVEMMMEPGNDSRHQQHSGRHQVRRDRIAAAAAAARRMRSIDCSASPTRRRSEAPKEEIPFLIGQAVAITEGPFTDFNGTVEEVMADKGKVRVSVSLFGRPTSVELDYLQLKGY